MTNKAIWLVISILSVSDIWIQFPSLANWCSDMLAAWCVSCGSATKITEVWIKIRIFHANKLYAWCLIHLTNWQCCFQTIKEIKMCQLHCGPYRVIFVSACLADKNKSHKVELDWRVKLMLTELTGNYNLAEDKEPGTTSYNPMYQHQAASCKLRNEISCCNPVLSRPPCFHFLAFS